MIADELRNLVRDTVREELASLTPDDLPVHRLLAERRKDLGYTQEAVAVRLCVSKHAIAQWEGGAMPTREAGRYARLLGMRLLLVPDGKQIDIFGEAS